MREEIGLYLLLKGTVEAVGMSLTGDYLWIRDKDGILWKVEPMLSGHAIPVGIGRLTLRECHDEPSH